MKPSLLITLFSLSLRACLKATTLEERLAGKMGREREQKLYYACIQLANYPMPGEHNDANARHESRMWAICDEMHNANTQEIEHATR